jgi:hypothetical protein
MLTFHRPGQLTETVVASRSDDDRLGWVGLVYAVPREPSTARIALWRRLRSLGVVQVSDGFVVLPEDARTRELLEWAADQAIEAGGTAMVLQVQTTTAADERAWARSMADARAAEYATVAEAATAALAGTTPVARRRTLKRLRGELRRIKRRDYFPPVERDTALTAVVHLADHVAADGDNSSHARGTNHAEEVHP